jgi:hypothetical protein
MLSKLATNKIDPDLVVKDLGSSCFTLENDSLNYPILSQLTNSDLNHIDYDYIDFNYLEANKVNVNFRRGQYKNKWLDPSHLEEIENLENELLFDKKLTFFEKSIILKHTIVPEKSRFSVWFSVFSTETETETDSLIFFGFKPKPKPKN